MAWKTPGVYFTEIDNTEFQNPAAEINTTVAIIGFAKKGPIGVPTEINTYNDYKSVFGTPIDGQFAGLAIRNILSAGGTVLFTRVADTTIASKSNVVLKNGSEATDGMLVVNRTADITNDMLGYDLSEVYSGRIKSPSGLEKNIILRTPAEGKLKLSKMFEQFKDSLKDTAGYDEFKVSKEIRNSSIRNFNLSFSAKPNDEENYSSVNETDFGPFFVNVAGNDKGNGNIANTISNIKSKLETMKTNAYQKFYIIGAYNNSENVVFDNIDPHAAALGLGETKRKAFRFVLTKKLVGKPEPETINMNVEFTGEADGNSSNHIILLSDVAETLTKAFEAKKQNIYVKYCYNTENSFGDEDYYTPGANAPYFLFVSMDDSIESFDITPFLTSNDDIAISSLFVPVMHSVYKYDDDNEIDLKTNYNQFKTTCFVVATNTEGNYSFGNMQKTDYEGGSEPNINLSTENFHTLFLAKQKCVGQIDNDIGGLIDVVYEDKTSSIRFVFNCGDTYKFADSKVEVKPTEFGGYLFNSPEIEEGTDVYLKNDNYNSIGEHLATVVGEDGIDATYKVAIIDGKISFFEEGNTIPGEFDTDDNITGYLPISDLLGSVVTEETYISNNYTNEDACIVAKEGVPELDSSKQDIVVFTAREYGEGTRDIGIKVYTSTSPIDGSKTHYISTIVNGTVKETWEDVSYDPSDENYFYNLINEEPENEGSAYIKVDVIKKDNSKSSIGLCDTKIYTGDDDMPVYLGRPLNSDSVNRLEANVQETEYEKYDYVVGNNGVPEDTTDLFVDAMDTLNSGLCNKDLYSWHILITPDNISEEVQDAAINLVEFMEDAIYIADPPQGLSRDKVVKWHNGKFMRGSALQSNYACTYWPWCKLYDSTAGKYVWAMPSVVMAAQFCKTDNWYAPWYAPAGETCGLMSSVLDIEEYPNKNDRDQLYLDQNRINPFLKLKNGNILAFGEKTTQRKNSTLTKIHTRRMLIALKHDLRNAIKGFLFLPTMTENISKIRGIVTAIMEEVKVGGGVASYVVICDETNNTTETLQQDILNIAVSCVPTGCIEQVEITFTLNKSAETVS